MYATIRIDKVYIKSERAGVACEDLMGVEVEYEDHRHKLDYVIEQPVYSAEEASFELLLPAQEEYFFVKYKFIDPRSKEREPFGQCYVNYPIADVIRANQFGANSIKKVNTVKVDVTRNGQVKGYCEFQLVFESDVVVGRCRCRR